MDGKDKDRHRKSLGRISEDAAADYLEMLGLRILARNFRSGSRELDIIAAEFPPGTAGNAAAGRPAAILCNIRIVEVKARQEPMEARPWESVRSGKRRNMFKAAESYIHCKEFRKLGIRCNEIFFDIVSIVWSANGEGYRLEYIPDAFRLIRT